jgi:hypothetical protein
MEFDGDQSRVVAGVRYIYWSDPTTLIYLSQEIRDIPTIPIGISMKV